MKICSIKSVTIALLFCIPLLCSSAQAQTSSPDYATLCRVFDTPAQQEQAGQMLVNYQINKQTKSDEIRTQELSQISTPQQVRARARTARTAFIKSMGGIPANTVPLKARVVGEIDRGDYVMKKVLFQDFDQMWVSAILYLPKPLGLTPRPAILSPMGHDSVGKEDGWVQERAIQQVKLGYIVLSYDPVGMGERWQYWDPKTGMDLIGSRDTNGKLTIKNIDTTAGHSYAGMQAWLVGQSMSQYMVWDGMRGIDYLLTLPEVDPNRIACSGASLGGSTTMMLAAIDPRVKCAVPTCDVTSYAEMARVKMYRDAEQIPLGINLGHWEEADALLPMLLHGGSVMINANKQDFFPIEGSRQAAKELKRLYTIAGVPTHFAFAENEGTHGWFPQTYASFYHFVGQVFSFGPANPQQTVTVKDTLKWAQLWCTPKGQVSAPPLNSKTVFDRTSDTAMQLQPKRCKKSDAQVLEAARTRSGVEEFPTVPTGKMVGQISIQGQIVEKWVLNIEPGISVPALFIHSQSKDNLPRKVLLYSSRDGKESVFNPQNFPLESWLAKGNAVLAVDVRGWGETRWASLSDGATKPFSAYFNSSHGKYGDEFKMVVDALQEGRPMLGQRATDLLASARWLDTQKGTLLSRNAEISLWGEGEAGVCALHAMAGDSHHIIGNVILDHSLYSYQDWATTRLYDVPVGLIIPGILEDYDLPQLARALQHRSHNKFAVIWVNPKSAKDQEFSLQQLEDAYKNSTGASDLPANIAQTTIIATPLTADDRALDLL